MQLGGTVTAARGDPCMWCVSVYAHLHLHWMSACILQPLFASLPGGTLGWVCSSVVSGMHLPLCAVAGRMHFVKFETARIEDCLDFIEAKGLHRCMLRDGSSREVRVKATGGGAIKFAGGRSLWCAMAWQPVGT